MSMDALVAMGVAAIIEAMQDKRAIQRLAPKLAKLFIVIERAAETSPVLSGAIIGARRKP